MSKQRYQVLLTDADRFPISEADQTTLEALGAEILEVPYGIEEDELINACRDVDAVIVYSPKMTERVIHSMKRCQIMARCGIGIDNIDISAAINKGIVVTYVPDYCIEEVSDHTIALMFDCWRRISLSNERVRKGHWDSYRELGQMRRIAGQSIGYVGFGRIAQAVSRKLQTFNVHMKAYDPNLSTQFISSYGVQPVSFNELVESCDLISLHVPLLKDTWHMINQTQLIKSTSEVAVTFFGDGAMNQGVLHETMNMASLWKIPMIFVCENNGYAVTFSADEASANPNFAERAAAYRMPSQLVDGMNVKEVYKAAQAAVERARNGEGPTFLECKTYRYMGHHTAEATMGFTYRTKEEIEQWKLKDPIRQFISHMEQAYSWSALDQEQLESDIIQEIEAAVEYARVSPNPSPEDSLLNMYSTPYEGIPAKGWM